MQQIIKINETNHFRGSSLDRERFSNVIGRNGFENDKSNFITSPGGTRFTPSAPAPTPPPYNNRDRLGNGENFL